MDPNTNQSNRHYIETIKFTTTIEMKECASASALGPDQLVDISANDVHVKYSQGKQRTETLLFKFVRGGNVQLVAKTLNELKMKKMTIQRKWVLGLGIKPPKTVVMKLIGFLLRLLLFMVTYICMIILTPIFYLLHGASNMFFSACRERLSETMDLPLAYAMLSENKPMVNLFVDNGVKLNQTDNNGNNVFHFLADLSKDNYPKAKDCLDLMVQLFPLEEVRRCIVEEENYSGLTPLDHLSLYGSLHLMKDVSEIQGVLCRTVIAVDDDDISIRADEVLTNNFVSISPRKHSAKMAGTVSEDKAFCIHRYDITQYEQGDIFSKQSKLLKYLTERDYISAEEEELEALTSLKWVMEWSKMKLKATKLLYILDRIHLLLVGIAYLYVTSQSNGGYLPYPLASTFVDYSVAYVKQKMAENGNVNFTEVQIGSYAVQVMYTLLSPTLREWPNDTVHIGQVVCTKDTHLNSGGYNLDSCSIDAFKKIYEKCQVHGLHMQDIKKQIGLNSDKHRYYFNEVLFAMLVPQIINLISDVIFRTVFLFRNYPAWKGGIFHGLSVFLGTQLPMKYTEKQLSTCSSLLICFIIFVVQFMFNSTTLEEFNYRHQILIHIMATELVVLMFQLIFILRLFPVIGLFIRTIIYLMKNLMEFIIVYLVVGLSFATIFSFMLVDEQCPAAHIEGYDTLWDTFYSVYLAMLGQGKLPIDLSILMKTVYALYSLLSAVMLLNLIIAVMGTTTDKVMVSPWKDVLYSMDRLSVALYYEAFLQTFFFPCRKWVTKKLTRSEACVEYDIGGQRRLYIQVETDKL